MKAQDQRSHCDMNVSRGSQHQNYGETRSAIARSWSVETPSKSCNLIKKFFLNSIILIICMILTKMSYEAERNFFKVSRT